MTQDIKLVCRDCKKEFVFSAGEQKFFEQRGFNPPSRCPQCRKKKKEKHSSTQDNQEENNSNHHLNQEIHTTYFVQNVLKRCTLVNNYFSNVLIHLVHTSFPSTFCKFG